MYIRFAVYAPGKSPLDAAQTPLYFKENQYHEAEKYALACGGYILDLLSEGLSKKIIK